MKKMKLAIIGNGGIARAAHAPYYLAMENVELVAACDIVLEKAEQFAKDFNIPKAIKDYEEVFEIEGLDAVDICTPNYLHSEIAVKALNKGINVFCEKPDAISVEEALKMKEAADKSGKILMVMRNNRYSQSLRFLKNYISSGQMGEIYSARCGWVRRRGIPGKGGWFTTKAQSGGGPLIDLGAHMIDASIWLMGNPKPVSVSGCAYTKFADRDDISDSEHSKFGEKKQGGIFDVEDLAMGFIRFDNGACMQIEFSWASNVAQEDIFIELRGTKAGSEWHYASKGQVRIFTEAFGKTADYMPNLPAEDGATPHGKNLEHFADCVINGTAPGFVPQQGVDVIKLLCAFYESAKTGREVTID
jgi:predicted dehydrogenase